MRLRWVRTITLQLFIRSQYAKLYKVLALKTDMASEKTYSVDFYDYSVFILWVILVPATFFLCVWSKFRSVIEDDIAEHEMNPNRK